LFIRQKSTKNLKEQFPGGFVDKNLLFIDEGPEATNWYENIQHNGSFEQTNFCYLGTFNFDNLVLVSFLNFIGEI
jgi:hypothetical protein